ncbi:MAG: 2-hydroxychromene-2-carboxylate isomerase [Beijerinckiaceae bacterium]
MEQTIEHYFSPMSGFAYLGVAALGEISRLTGVPVVHKPVDIQALFAAQEIVPPAKQSAARLRWRRTDMERWARRRKLPLEIEPKYWPVDATRAACVIIAANQRQGGDWLYIEKILAAVWARNLDISDESVLRLLARECNYDPDALIDLADSPATIAQYGAFTREAVAKGVVGSPTFAFGGKLFFGQDRLDFLHEAISAQIGAVRSPPEIRTS